MDETVYQCPECNFNADNLTELDGHILEFHSNETLKNSDRNEVNEDECDGDAVNHSNVITDQEDDDDILIENELPTDSARFNQSNYSNDDNNEIFNDDYYYENQNDYSNNNNNNNGFDNKKIDNLIIQNRLPITTNNNNKSNSIANKPHNLRQKQPIDYNGLNEASSADNNFTLPIVPKLALNATPINDSSSSSSSNINRRSATSSIQPTPISAVNPNVPIINSDNHYERQYTCKRCGFFTNNPRAVLYHRKEYHFEKINIHECTYCQYASQYSGKVERHTLLRHKIDINNSPSKKSMNQKAKSSSLTSENNNKTLEIKSNNLNSADLVINRSLISSQEKQTDSDSTTSTPINNNNNKLAINETVLPFSNNNNNNNLPKYQCNKCPCKYKRSNDLYKHLKLKHGVLAQHINDYLTPVSAFASSSETATAPTTSSVNPTQSNNDLMIDEQTDDLVIEDNQYADESEIKEDLFNEQVVLDENNGKQEIKKNSYECPYCTYHSNGNDAEYLLHVKDHLCGKSFRCVLCNSVYKYRGDCVVHLKRKHQKADLYAQNYVERFNLDTLDIGQVCILLKPKQQEETENEEKLFSCSYCDYKANYKGDVFKHQTRRHPGSPKNVTSLVPNLNQNGSENSGMILNNNKQIRNNLFVSTALFNGDNHNNIKNNIITSKNSMLNNNSNNNINNNVIHNNENNNDNEIIEIDSNYSNNDYYYNNSQVNETNYSNKHDNINNDQYYEEDQVNEFNDNNNNNNNVDDDDDENLFNENQDYDANNNDLEIINDYEGQDYNNYDEEIIDNHSNNNNNNNNNRNLIDSEDLNINASSSFNRFQCKFCSFVGKNHAKLQLHLATHYNLKPFVCPICNRRANFKWDIQKHLRKIHNDYVSEVICLSETEARQSISSYIEGKQPIIFENNPNSLVLNHRPTSSLSSQSNNSISNNKLTTNQFEELEDDDEQNYDSYQQQSQQQHHTSLNASSLANLRLLARKRTQHALRERKFKCSLCNRTSKWQWDIRKHLRTVHRGQLGGDVIVLREIEIPKKFNHHESSTSPIKSIQNQNNYLSHNNKFQISNGVNNIIQQQRTAFNRILNGGETNALSSSQANALQRSKILISQKQSQFNSNQQKTNQIPVIASPVIPTCSDPTGNKKFKCTVCPYRSNWKADLFRHLKKRHFVNQPQLENVIILDSEYAASSLEEYEQVHGINVRKRSRTDLDLINCAAMINESMTGNDFNKKSKIISDSSMINGDGEEQLDQQNELQQQENNIEFLNRNNRLPVSIAELNIKPYKCLKCGFRSDRKSDTLRHIRVKHMQTVNAIKFLRIMSIKEASDTIESYENMRLYKKIKSFNFDNTPNVYSDASTVNPTTNDEKTDHEVMNNTATASVNYNKNHVAKNENEITIKNHATNNKSAEFTHANKCCDFYRCPFCSFKNINKHIMRRHLCIHFSNQKIKINPLFKCNICCFKSKWKFSVKKHILMNHSTQNAYVLKVINNKKNLKKINNNNEILNENDQIKTKQSDNCAQAVNYNDNLNNEFDEEDLCEVEDEGEEDDVEDENETEDSNGYSFQNCENLKIENDSCLLNDDDDTNKTVESILLTGYDGVQFQASFLVSNPMYKKKCYFCQACPYKTSNYSNLRQHLLQHRYREGYSKCRYCVYYVSKVRLLKQHEILHPEFELRLTAKQSKQNQLKL